MDKVKEIRRAYILAKALNFQYQYIREIVNSDMVKVINEAKAKNSYFIKRIDDKFEKHHAMRQVEKDEELAFQFLEQIEQL